MKMKTILWTLKVSWALCARCPVVDGEVGALWVGVLSPSPWQSYCTSLSPTFPP